MNVQEQIAELRKCLTLIGKNPDDYAVVLTPSQEAEFSRSLPDGSYMDRLRACDGIYMHVHVSELTLIPMADVGTFIENFPHPVA